MQTAADNQRLDRFRRQEEEMSAEALADATVFDVHTGKGQGDDLAASSRAIACLQLTA